MPDELDAILDEAIKSYSAAEPSPDLAARILYQSQLHTVSPRRGWKLALAFALPIAAAVTLAFVFAGRINLPAPPEPIASAPSTPSVAAQPQPAKMLAAAVEPVPTHRKVHKALRRDSWARPLPPPYSKEELALLNFVQQHPKEAAEIAEAQKEQTAAALEPITVPPIQIKPITIAALD